MEIKRIKAALAGLVIIGLTLTACSGDDGDTGPRGPAGVDGTNGVDGTANVTSNTYNVLAADWTLIQFVDGGGNPVAFELRDTITGVTSITQDVVDKGTVQAFISTDDGVSWSAMPFSNFTDNCFYRYEASTVYLTVNRATLSAPTAIDVDIKVVAIPAAAMIDGVDVTNYEELQAVYGLEEYNIPQFNTKD